jgi:hypothetical protein
MAALTLSEKAALNSIRLIFGRNSNDTKEFFESIGIQAVLNYARGEKIVVPFIGEIEISYDGDKMTDKGRVAKLKTSFTPSSFLIRNIGQIQDGGPTEAEKILTGRFRSVFKDRVK